MRRVIFCVLFFASALAPARHAGAAELLFEPLADTYVSSDKQSSNFGAATAVEADASPVERGLFRFAVSGVGSGAVTNVKLRLFNTNSSSLGGNFSRVAASPDWTEAGVTWNTAPATVGAPVASLGAVSSGRWYEVDVSAIVTGDGTFDIALTSPSSSGAGYASKEASPANRPRLVITIDDATTSPSPTPAETATPTQSPSATPDPTLGPTPTPPPPATVVFPVTADAYVRSDKPASNFGAAPIVEIDTSPSQRGLLRFVVSGVGSDIVSSAKLRLFNTNDSSVGGSFMRLASAEWTESTVNWNTAPPEIGPAVASLGAVSTGRWYEVELSAIITGDGIFDVGIATPSSNGAGYASKDATTTANHPQLVVTVGAGDPTAPHDSTPPVAPADLRATAIEPDRVDLAWNVSSDDLGVTGYDVFRDGGQIAWTNATTYSDTGVAPDRSYTYVVKARDDAGNVSSPSNALTVTTPREPGISFGAGGDWGANSKTAKSLNELDSSGVNFFLVVGDLDYGEVSSPTAWCAYVKSYLPTLGANFPLQLLPGNHEESTIQEHAACLPDRLNSTFRTGSPYPTEYYFDYPSGAPLVRVLMISPALTVDNVSYKYSAGSSRYNWVADAIDDARTNGVPWLVVGMHKNCFTSSSSTSCEVGADLMNMLVEKKVDLIIQGHKHTYKRGKQLALGSACSSIAGGYDADCVVDDGADHVYVKGSGSIVLINGSFGKGDSSSAGGYFARAGGGNGFTKFTVTADRIDAEFVNSTSSFRDAYVIRR